MNVPGPTIAYCGSDQDESAQICSHSSLTIPSLHCTVGLYLCVLFFLCSQNKFVSRPEPLRCRAVLFIRGDIMLLFLVRSCSLVLHSAGLGFSPPGFMVCSRQSVRSTMSAASHTKKRTHLQTHTHKVQYLSRNPAYTAGVRYTQIPTLTGHFNLP